MVEEPAGSVHGRQLASGPETRIDAQDTPAPCRGRQEQVSQVVGKDLECGFLGALLRLQAEFHLDGGSHEPLV